ncbi:hypothetical protein D5272_10485 [bacterium D16-76]|nr:hypothetical protein [bacterium D16-76]
MTKFCPGSHVYELVTLLSFAGEYPFHSLDMLGSKRVYKALIVKLTQPEQFVNTQTGEQMACRLFTVTGGGQSKTVRLYKKALHILDWVHPGAYPYYMSSFWEHRLPGDMAHIDRHHRVAEAAALCGRAGMEARPFYLPKLQNQMIAQTIPPGRFFYLARDMKRVTTQEVNKTAFTRLVGAAFYPGGCYAVYNTRRAAMKWNGMGELKARYHLADLCRMNTGIQEISSALFLGWSEEIALQSFLEKSKGQKVKPRADAVYRHIHFISMDKNGVRQLRLLTAPNWRERLLDLLFDPETRSYDRGMFEYDACVDSTYVLSYLDGDLARLIRFKEGTEGHADPLEVLCFPHQVGFLREYLAGRAVIKTIEMDAVEAALEIERRGALA